MAVLFQVLRWFFYCFTVIMGILLVRWDIILWEGAFWIVKEIAMPWYLVFCWLMIGNLIGIIWQWKNPSTYDLNLEQSILNKSFIIGVVIGIVLALCYIML
jgi:hypothetical protein